MFSRNVNCVQDPGVEEIDDAGDHVEDDVS